MTPHVWLADAEDLDGVVALMEGFRDWMGYDALADGTIRETAARLLRDPNTDFLLGAAEPGAAAAGVCQLRYRLSVWTGTADCWLEDLYVDEGSRRSGIGRALVEAALGRARERGCRRIELDADEEDAGLLDFYRGLGFSTEPKPPGRNLFLSREF